MHSSFFILSRISSATISPLKQSMIGEAYSLPSAHCTSVISVRNFSEGRWALKSRFRMFSCSCASVVVFVIPCGTRFLCDFKCGLAISLETNENCFQYVSSNGDSNHNFGNLCNSLGIRQKCRLQIFGSQVGNVFSKFCEVQNVQNIINRKQRIGVVHFFCCSLTFRLSIEVKAKRR